MLFFKNFFAECELVHILRRKGSYDHGDLASASFPSSIAGGGDGLS
jgi:hypothetical protein